MKLAPLCVCRYVIGQPHAKWTYEVLPDLPASARPLACVVHPGEMIYVPSYWFHATINLDVYNVFLSTFAANPDQGAQ